MEQLLHYCWKHKILPLRPLQTTDGRTVENFGGPIAYYGNKELDTKDLEETAEIVPG